jgi:hypothetical protein
MRWLASLYLSPSAPSAKSAVEFLLGKGGGACQPPVPTRLQSILQKAFTRKLLTADNADNTDKK